MILQRKLNKDAYEEIEYDLAHKSITEKQLDRMKYSENSKDRKYYKKVQEYEDARDDDTIRKGIVAFKVSLATAALAASVLLTNFVGTQVKETLNTDFYKTSVTTTLDETPQEKKDEILSKSSEFANKVIDNDGYHFDSLSDFGLADGYYRIINYEKKISEGVIKGAFSKITENRDQTLLEDIVEKSFGEDYETLTDAQKRDYKQLAFELLPYSLPDAFENGNNYLRNPIVMDELSARNDAKEKGYTITLKVNGDETETVRNLGNIMHILNQMQEDDYKLASLTESGQEEFFCSILEEVLGDKYGELSKTQIRDYQQIIFEWLPDEAKQYIKDPIIVEKNKQAEQQVGGIEIGD